MRKILSALALVFALAFTLGAVGPTPAEAAGGGDCFYTCVCPGTPLRCCRTSTGSVACKPTDDIQCPQVAC